VAEFYAFLHASTSLIPNRCHFAHLHTTIKPPAPPLLHLSLAKFQVHNNKQPANRGGAS
jgi:hypothetical protein